MVYLLLVRSKKFGTFSEAMTSMLSSLFPMDGGESCHQLTMSLQIVAVDLLPLDTHGNVTSGQ